MTLPKHGTGGTADLGGAYHEAKVAPRGSRIRMCEAPVNDSHLRTFTLSIENLTLHRAPGCKPLVCKDNVPLDLRAIPELSSRMV